MSRTGIRTQSVLKMGNSSHGVVLPKEWVDKNNLSKDKKVAVYYDNFLLISPTDNEEEIEKYVENIIEEEIKRRKRGKRKV